MKIVAIFSLFFFFSITSVAQNTKGDKPVSNQRQVRESKGKTRAQKGNKKPKTKDISGRRLRTKDKSSANRANVGIQQPDTYRGRKKSQSDRAAKPQGRIFSAPPRDRQRAWKGDLSGSPIRRIKPSKSGVARSNVYPQQGPYVNNPSQTPKKEKPKVYTRTASGEVLVKRKPQNKQRAWKGDIKGGPIGAPSRTGQVKNIYPQFGEYQNHPSRKPRSSERIQSGPIGVARYFSTSSSPWPGKKKKVKPRSASQSYVSRGKKNVYWGKYSKSGKAVTRDITGKPLRTRNFHSTPAGLISRDTLRTFGRKPGGDRASKQKGRGFVAKGKAQNAWTGDLSGKKLRKSKPRTTQTAGQFVFPRKLSITKSGEVGKPLPGGGVSAQPRRRKRVETNSLPGRPPGGGGIAVSKYLGNLKGRRTPKGGGSESGKLWNNNGQPIYLSGKGAEGSIRAGKFQGNFKRGQLTPGFSRQGESYSGNIKSRRPVKGGGSVSGKQWNNKGQPIDVNGAGKGTIAGSKYQGNFKRSELTPNFSSQGAGWAGNIKSRRPEKGGGSVSGKLWNNKGQPIDVNGAGKGTIAGSKYQGNFKRSELTPNFSSQGAGWAGNIKSRRPEKGGGSVSGKLWNNKGQPIDVNGAGKGTIAGSKYQGNFKRSELTPNFSSQGAGWAGNIKSRRPEKGGGSVSGKLWNNNGQPIDVNEAGSGTIKGSQFQGNIKTRRPEKGGGSVSGKLWNNNGQPIDVNEAGSGTIKGSQFQGNVKTRRPEKGGGSVSGKLWNNNEQPIDVNEAGSGTIKGARFQGNIKTRKPVKGGGSVSGKLWNNNEQPIEVIEAGSGTIKASQFQGRMKKGYVQNPNASKLSTKKLRPDETTFSVAGLGVKVREGHYKDRPKATDGSMPGIAPDKSSVKAAEYAKGVKLLWSYKHNPNSADRALKGFYSGKAIARLGDYQGNVKMHKYSGSQLHPDSKFAHSFNDNVKEERTLLMNMKLFWAKLFKKSEGQPENLKENIRKPRYDKGEKGMWYE